MSVGISGGAADMAARRWRGGGASARVVSLRGTTAITSPPSVTVGRPGMTAVASDASNARGASAISDSETLFQSSPDRFCTIPQACRLAPAPTPVASLSMTSRYDGRHTGVEAMYPTCRSCSRPSSAMVTVRSPRDFAAPGVVGGGGGGGMMPLDRGVISAGGGGSGGGTVSSSLSTSMGNDADLTELPPRSSTASVARKSPTSSLRTRNCTRSDWMRPPRSK